MKRVTFRGSFCFLDFPQYLYKLTMGLIGVPKNQNQTNQSLVLQGELMLGDE